jgi:hypothetical protein
VLTAIEKERVLRSRSDISLSAASEELFDAVFEVCAKRVVASTRQIKNIEMYLDIGKDTTPAMLLTATMRNAEELSKLATSA